jgi:hypothetical protein
MQFMQPMALFREYKVQHLLINLLLGYFATNNVDFTQHITYDLLLLEGRNILQAQDVDA